MPICHATQDVIQRDIGLPSGLGPIQQDALEIAFRAIGCFDAGDRQFHTDAVLA